MRVTANSRIKYVWIVTSGLAILAWGLATIRSGQRLTASTPEAIAVLAIAAVKAHLIIGNFMEVRTAPQWLRRFTTCWLAGLCATILIMYLSST